MSGVVMATGVVAVDFTSTPTVGNTVAFSPILDMGNGSAGLVSVGRLDAPTTYRLSFGFNGVQSAYRVESAGGFCWSGTAANANASIDLGLARAGAGIMEINNGTVGTLATLRAAAANLGVSTAIAAGGNSGQRLTLTSSLIGMYVGSGVPTISAAQGSIYLRSDGSSTSTRAYINTDGATTWTAVTTAA
jgi:hypothetical protein